MIAPLLEMALQPVTEQHRRFRFLTLLTIWWAVIACIGVFLVARGQATSPALAVLVLAAGAGAVVVRAFARRWRPDLRQIARRIEERHRELHALLVTAVEQEPDPKSGALNFLQQRVVDDAIHETRRNQWLDAVPAYKRIAATILQLGALVAMLCVFREFSAPASQAGLTAAQPTETSVAVTPGDASVERGSSLVVLANFQGPMPGEAALVVEPENQAAEHTKLVKSLSDPIFGGSIPEVTSNLKYHVEYAGQSTRDFSIRVFDHPRLDRADAVLHYPEYTKLPEKTLPDTRRVSAVEGTKLDVAFSLNKPVKSAVLTPKEGAEIPLETDPEKAVANLRSFDVEKSQAYELKLVDADGRTNKVAVEFIIQALPNRRPELKFASPKGDKRVSPIQEMTFAGQAWDDFGISRYGLAINVAGGGEKEIELGRDTKADERKDFFYVLRLEDLGVKPDELVSWYLWAEDVGPDGKTRRTATDMFFGEVRPFEEIYRAGDSAQAEERERQQREQEQNGGGGAGEQAQKLAESQKQVITATWNLKRAEDANSGEQKPSAKYLEDEPVVRDGQSDAQKKVEAMKEKADDPKTLALVDDVLKQMNAAHDRLVEAEKSPEPLSPALASEQSAYNALLKLSAHEYEVTKRQQRSRQQGQRGQSAQQREQLDQLEMKDEEQRYETTREATQQPQNQQQREQLAVLNRLKELAQRQQDINERLKEIQAALQEAKTPEAKKTLDQQLERLREEEQQLLSDLDESRQKMEQSPQQAQLAEERQKMEQTRGEAQETAEAMQRKAASQALASGSRTARQLQDIRDSYRKKTSGQFNDEMRQMRNDARTLAESQQELSDKLAATTKPADRPTLADDDQERKAIGEKIDKQQERLSSLTDQMKRVSEEADSVEPLLAKEVYDTLRKITQAGTDDKLKNVKLLTERGINAQAQPIEEQARTDIEDLKSGVEKAAESVLGNEAESIRQARNELDGLSQQLQKEIKDAKEKQNGAGASQSRNRDNQRQAQNGKSGAQQPGDRNQNENGAQGERTAQNGSGAQRNRDAQNGGQRGGRGDQQNDASAQQGERTAQNGEQPDGQGGQRSGGGQQNRNDQNGGQRGGQGDQQNDQSAQQGERTAQNGEQPDGQGGQRSGGAGQRNRNAQNGGQRGGQGDQQNNESAQQGERTAQNGGQEGEQRDSQNAGGRGGQRQANAQGGGGGGGSDQAGQREIVGENGIRLLNTPNKEAGRSASRQRQSDAELEGGSHFAVTPSEGDAANAGGADNRLAGFDGGNGGGGGAVTGGRYVEWSDRLRNVEEMLDSPRLRNEAARIREVAKGVRVEFKKTHQQPDWDMVEMQISAPLTELRDQLTEELARRDSKESLVPIDRDPVPPKYAERVRSYYEELGKSK